ncbi:MAG: toll/interleukin-1 receptor domain-containing protein [Bryobacteraceae bacterium]
MERVDKTVFVSYRRTNFPWALAIFQNLTQHGYDAFFDYNGIASGDFERVILGNIASRAHFLVLLTPSALERCGDREDWLRREIEAAVERKRNIVPLMLEGFHFGKSAIDNQLTGKLAALKHYNGLIITPEYFLEAMDRLRDRYLNVPLHAVLHPASLSAQRAATEQKAAAETAPVVPKRELTAQQWFERVFNASDARRATVDVVRIKSWAERLARCENPAVFKFFHEQLEQLKEGRIAGTGDMALAFPASGKILWCVEVRHQRAGVTQIGRFETAQMQKDEDLWRKVLSHADLRYHKRGNLRFYLATTEDFDFFLKTLRQAGQFKWLAQGSATSDRVEDSSA